MLIQSWEINCHQTPFFLSGILSLIYITLKLDIEYKGERFLYILSFLFDNTLLNVENIFCQLKLLLPASPKRGKAVENKVIIKDGEMTSFYESVA